MELTEAEFWNDYWRNCPLPARADPGFPFERCLAAELRKVLPVRGGEALEIGCAPGKWMAFLYDAAGLIPSGIEYSDVGLAITRRNLEAQKVPYGNLWAGDFFSLPPEPRFDAVVSLGFIEHFDAPDSVVARHLEWLKPGGTLVLGVPNFRGIHGFIQRFYGKEILLKHNLEVMSLEYFRALGEKYGLILLKSSYIGSFEPSLPVRGGGKAPLVRLLGAFLTIAARLRRPAFLDGFNGRRISSYILSAYKKKDTL